VIAAESIAKSACCGACAGKDRTALAKPYASLYAPQRAKPFAARAEDAPRASAPLRHGDLPVAQFLLEHRDRRPGIALLALAHRDGGRVADREAANAPGAFPECLEERLAIVLIAHGRLALLLVAKPTPTTKEAIAAKRKVDFFI